MTAGATPGIRNARRLRLAAAAVLVALVAAWGLPAAAEHHPLYNAPPTWEAEVEFHTMRLGPIQVAAMDEVRFMGTIPTPEIDVPGLPHYGITSATFDVVDTNLDPVPKEDFHLHHMVFMWPGHGDPACPGRSLWFHLGAGQERTPLALPEPYAFKVPDNQSWVSNYHLMNMKDEAVEVYVEYTFGVQPDAVDANTRWVQPWFLDVDGCGNAEFDVPGDGGPGSVYALDRTWTMPADGVIVGTGAHLHDGGIATELTDSSDRLICRSEAVYGPGEPHDGHGQALGGGHGNGEHGPTTGTIDHIPGCATHWHFRAGERLTLTTTYDNSRPWHGAMGINLTFIWFGNQSAGLPAFPDVPPGHPFHEAVTWGLAEGITDGFPDGSFGPMRHVTRQALMAFLYRLAGEPEVDHGNGHHAHTAGGGHHDHHPFTDVGPHHPFHDAIAWGAAEGITTGFPDGSFRSADAVTRQAAMAWIYRFAGEPEVDHGNGHHAHTAGGGHHDHHPFTDVGPHHPFHDAIAWGAAEGITTGFPDGSFRPAATVVRQAAMVFLFRYAGLTYVEHLEHLYDQFWEEHGPPRLGHGNGHEH